MQSELAEKTLDLVRQSDIPLTKIAEETGLGFEWLRSFAYGKINIHNAAVSRVEALHNFLAKTAVK